jgi:hypothetical protein
LQTPAPAGFFFYNLLMPKDIPKVVKFLKLELPDDIADLDIEDYKKFLSEFLIPFQGEDVMIIEKSSIPIEKYLILFEALNFTSLSVALEDINKEKYLIFDHNFQDVYYLEDINTEFKNINFKSDKEPLEVLGLNLEQIYEENKDLEKALEEMRKIIVPAQVCVLKGIAPLLLFLIISYGLRPLVGELYYEKVSELIKIF